MNTDIRVLELLASRICHDLVSPVGAIRNGLELIEEMEEEPAGGFLGEAIKLIDHSSIQANRRLRLFRVAYGIGGRDANGFNDARAIIVDWLEGSRTRLDWPAGSVGDRAAGKMGAIKTLLATLMLAEEALTHGGILSVAGEGDGARARLTVSGSGRPGALSAEAAAALAAGLENGRDGGGWEGEGQLTPRTVHAYLTGRMAAAYGLTLTHATPAPETLLLTLAW